MHFSAKVLFCSKKHLFTLKPIFLSFAKKIKNASAKACKIALQHVIKEPKHILDSTNLSLLKRHYVTIKFILFND